MNMRWLDGAMWVVGIVMLIPLLWHLVLILWEFARDIWIFGL